MLPEQPQYDDLLREATKMWGRSFNRDMLTEEAAELIVALRHYDRGRVLIHEVVEEVADVLILIEQLIVDENVRDFVNLTVADKMARLEQRLHKKDCNHGH